jgi:acyl carrier protein
MLIKPVELVAQALECDPASISIDSGFDKHPKWDSFGHLAIMVALEQQYGVSINDVTIRKYEAMPEIQKLYDSLQATEGRA